MVEVNVFLMVVVSALSVGKISLERSINSLLNIFCSMDFSTGGCIEENGPKSTWLENVKSLSERATLLVTDAVSEMVLLSEWLPSGSTVPSVLVVKRVASSRMVSASLLMASPISNAIRDVGGSSWGVGCAFLLPPVAVAGDFFGMLQQYMERNMVLEAILPQNYMVIHTYINVYIFFT